MGSFEVDEYNLKIYCLEWSEEHGNWCEVDISEDELIKLKANSRTRKANKVSAYDLFNDGRKIK